jgi:peptide chain release factor 1
MSLNPRMRGRLEHLALRLSELDAILSQPDATSDMGQWRKLNREHAELSPVVASFTRYTQTEADIATAQELLAAPDTETDMQELAEMELSEGQTQLERLANELQTHLLPRDPNDERNLFLEIRAGTGGEESALFAADLLRMYTRFAERQGWRVEVTSASASDLGGYKEVILRIAALGVQPGQPGAYSRLKFESGGHRVQRVPTTEAQGRIHTSACTVAVMPEADEVEDVNIRSEDIRIDTFRASGAGGQHINKTDSAVRITHLPTGIVVECQDDRSQHRNKDSAMKVLAARIKDQQLRAAQAAEASTRKSLVGSGDRSDRIRTYNFPQGRVTDHRINLTLYKIDMIMDGDLDDILNALAAEHQAELLARLADDL